MFDLEELPGYVAVTRDGRMVQFYRLHTVKEATNG